MDMEDFSLEWSQALRDLALRAWSDTYKDIFPDKEIHSLVDRFYSDEMNRFTLDLMAQGLAAYRLLVDGGILRGFHTATLSEDHAELRRIYLDPLWIGHGWGKALLADAEAFLVRGPFSDYIVKVHTRNQRGKAFYTRNGFIPMGREGDEEIWRKGLNRIDSTADRN